jgi:TetR/AcrR family transcriptional repressor of nem operon
MMWSPASRYLAGNYRGSVAASKRAPRRTPDADSIIRTTIELLHRDGESGFRLEDLMEAEQLSKSSIYARYGGRDGLLATALAKEFEDEVAESVIAMRTVMGSAKSAADLRNALKATTAFVHQRSRNVNRINRAGVIAGTRGRPELRARLEESQTRLTDTLEQLIGDCMQRGLIATRHHPRALATFLQANTLGAVLTEFDSKDDSEAMNDRLELIHAVLDFLFFDGLIDA